MKLREANCPIYKHAGSQPHLDRLDFHPQVLETFLSRVRTGSPRVRRLFQLLLRALHPRSLNQRQRDCEGLPEMVMGQLRTVVEDQTHEQRDRVNVQPTILVRLASRWKK